MKRLALPIILASTLLSQLATAQSSTTPVIGYYKFDVAPGGGSTYSCGFVTKIDWQGAATSVTPGVATSTIGVAGTPWGVDQYNGAAGSYYVEVVTVPTPVTPGPNDGLIFDITDTTSNSLTVSGDLTGLPGTQTFAIRKHSTVGSVFPDGAGLVSGQDLISLIKPNGDQVDVQYNGFPLPGGLGVQFDNLTEGGNADSIVIRPGQGFIISNFAENPVTVTFGGGAVSYVKSTVTKIELATDVVNLVGLINPLVSTTPALVADQRTVAQWFNDSVLQVDGAGASQIDILFADGSLGVSSSIFPSGANFYDPAPSATTAALPIRNGAAVVITNSSGSVLDYTIPVLHP